MPTPARRAIFSRAAFRPHSANTSWAAATIRSRLRSASARRPGEPSAPAAMADGGAPAGRPRSDVSITASVYRQAEGSLQLRVSLPMQMEGYLRLVEVSCRTRRMELEECRKKSQLLVGLEASKATRNRWAGCPRLGSEPWASRPAVACRLRRFEPDQQLGLLPAFLELHSACSTRYFH